MDQHDISRCTDTLCNTWENLKSLNNERLDQLANHQPVDPLVMEQLQRMNLAIEEQATQIRALTEQQRCSTPAEIKSLGNPVTNPMEDVRKAAFDEYLRKGVDVGLAQLESKAMSAGTESDGGYLVNHAIQQMVNSALAEASIMRQIAAVQEISTSALDLVDDANNLATSWNAETTAVEDTDTPMFVRKSIVAHELVAQPKATQKLLDDAFIDIDAWIADKLATAFLAAEDNAFINGDGNNKPSGILNYPAAELTRIASGAGAAALDSEDIFKLLYALPEEYARNAVLLTNRTVLQKLRLLTDNNGQYLWQPNLNEARIDTILGIPVYQSSYIPAAAAGSESVIIGDFHYYQIVDRTAIRILRDPFTAKPYVRFYSTKRVGGDVVRTAAFKVLTLGK